jgi:hypothetical protein
MKIAPLAFITLLTVGLGITAVSAIEKLAYDTYAYSQGW